ncbi:MAG: TetR/AcrR family transcriptional regulator [Chitinophagaceae bacterium]|nr:TetR/AcrR family transcriptional regulator [Chitinophagaceae bacterium]
MEPRERIQVKANELFMRYGIRSVSMDDIAAQLGMSKKTIYQFFADKDELVDAVVDDEINGLQKDCSQCSVNAKDAIHEIFLTMAQVVEQFRQMNPMVLYDLEKFHFKAYQKFLRHKHEYLGKIISSNIERGIREEFYRPEINIDIMSKFRLESMMLGFNIEVFPVRKYNPADVAKVVIEHYVYGLSTIKGHKQIQKYKQEYVKKLSSDEK